MRKTIKILTFTLVIAMMLVALAIPSLATNSDNLVVDKENIFTSYQEEVLQTTLYSISKKHQCEIVVVTTRGFGSSSAQEYAENYYISHGYGYGSDFSGVLLLISESERYYYICTSGKGEEAISGPAFKKLSNEVKSLLSEDQYYEASQKFAQMCDEALVSYAENGKPFDTSAFITGIIISAVIGIVAALSVFIAYKKKLHSESYPLDRYARLNLRINRDTFITKTVTRVKIQSSSGGGGRSGGGRSGGSRGRR